MELVVNNREFVIFSNTILITMSNDSVSVTGVVDNTQAVGSRGNLRTHVHVALNSARLAASQLHSLGEVLSLPTTGSVGDLPLMIEGKITELGHDPRNVQVALSRNKDGRSFTLSDHEGVFLTVNPEGEEECGDSSEGTCYHELPHSPEPTEEASELEIMRNERDELQATVDTLT